VWGWSPTPKPQRGGPGLHIYIPWRLGGPVILPGTKHPFQSPFTTCMGYSGTILFPGHHTEQLEITTNTYTFDLRLQEKYTFRSLLMTSLSPSLNFSFWFSFHQVSEQSTDSFIYRSFVILTTSIRRFPYFHSIHTPCGLNRYPQCCNSMSETALLKPFLYALHRIRDQMLPSRSQSLNRGERG
jgi:hypothetical protein